MQAHDVATILARLGGPRASSDGSATRTGAAFTKVASFDNGGVFVARFAGQTPWECHPSGDELLHILEGETDVVIRDDGHPVQVTLKTGSVFVVPRGRWHRQLARSVVTLLSVTPTPTRSSKDEPPSGAPASKRRPRPSRDSRPLKRRAGTR
jgi:mannose-6-phosphate isomerase-like protein (cupin superfamily)